MLCKILKGSIVTDEQKPDGSHHDVTYKTGDICDLPEAMIALHKEYCKALTPQEAAAHQAKPKPVSVPSVQPDVK